jgi:DNA-binding transcriptional regulator YdaS (Cro superfamily)
MMTPDLTILCRAIGWDYPTLAARLGCKPITVEKWAQGKRALPPSIITYLQQVLALQNIVTVPEWRVRQRKKLDAAE